MKNKLFILLLILTTGRLISQDIEFSEIPENYQLYSRDKNNEAIVKFKGSTNKESDVNKILLKVFINDSLIVSQVNNVLNNKFEFKAPIKAGLFEYRFELFNMSGLKPVLIKRITNVVCGDVYVITGQSNSHASNKNYTLTNNFCRSFGVKTGYENYSDFDKKIRWGLATGNCFSCSGEDWENGKSGGWFQKNEFGIGIWGMELANKIVQNHQIPVCIINGGSGSSTISQNLKYTEKEMLETSYGRLMYRLKEAGVISSVKGLIYHQGESDSDEKYHEYSSKFDRLYQDWKTDLVNLKKIYIFQIHPGCGGKFQSELRQIQSNISEKYKDISIMSTTGINGHDGCHFSVNGYKEFANRLFPVISQDFYGQKFSNKITPPKIIKSKKAGRGKKLELIFDQEIYFEKSKIVEGLRKRIRDQFWLTKKDKTTDFFGEVRKVKSKNNKMILFLKRKFAWDEISWVPNSEYIGTNKTYDGPWIYGKHNNIGALTFHKNKISN